MKLPSINKTLNISKFLHIKVYILLIIITLFSFFYLFLDDSHFSGLNTIQELIKEDLLKKKVGIEIEKQRPIFESLQNLEDFTITNNNDKENENENEKKALTKATKKLKEDVEKNEIKIEKIKPSMIQKYFNRLYFSVSTGCLLGYGDIYPITNIAKFLSMIQSIVTISLILY